jgi:hypothetical protein
MFTDYLVEAYYLRLFLQLSKIPHIIYNITEIHR